MCSIFPETKDSNFSKEELIARNNGELVAAWGNLVNRVLNFAHGRFDGKIPEPKELDSVDNELLSKIEKGLEEVCKLYEAVKLRDALKETLTLTREVNKYLDTKAPWTQFKTDPEASGSSVYVAVKAIDTLKNLFAPVLPVSSQKIHELLGYQDQLFGEQLEKEGEDSSYNVLTYKQENLINRFKLSEIKPGTPFEKPKPLFKFLEAEEKES